MRPYSSYFLPLFLMWTGTTTATKCKPSLSKPPFSSSLAVPPSFVSSSSYAATASSNPNLCTSNLLVDYDFGTSSMTTPVDSVWVDDSGSSASTDIVDCYYPNYSKCLQLTVSNDGSSTSNANRAIREQTINFPYAGSYNVYFDFVNPQNQTGFEVTDTAITFGIDIGGLSGQETAWSLETQSAGYVVPFYADFDIPAPGSHPLLIFLQGPTVDDDPSTLQPLLDLYVLFVVVTCNFDPTD
ncbi:hypothetical protein SEUCBS139899_010541 [Sporothrix eucalyptigena]|uniref:Uncharacterized protein n=1 Tax=Sporothrix eucalyptigena TaxID=1812306 RepID=A0ABP0BHJ5_9PEZI